MWLFHLHGQEAAGHRASSSVWLSVPVAMALHEDRHSPVVAAACFLYPAFSFYNIWHLACLYLLLQQAFVAFIDMANILNNLFSIGCSTAVDFPDH